MAASTGFCHKNKKQPLGIFVECMMHLLGMLKIYLSMQLQKCNE